MISVRKSVRKSKIRYDFISLSQMYPSGFLSDDSLGDTVQLFEGVDLPLLRFAGDIRILDDILIEVPEQLGRDDIGEQSGIIAQVKTLILREGSLPRAGDTFANGLLGFNLCRLQTMALVMGGNSSSSQ